MRENNPAEGTANFRRLCVIVDMVSTSKVGTSACN